jgi:hypothetical protein
MIERKRARGACTFSEHAIDIPGVRHQPPHLIADWNQFLNLDKVKG